jgi:hypothetical protein
MDTGIRRLLGIVNDGKRVYQISEADSEVSREEFEHARIIYDVTFVGDKSYAATLGSTWSMVMDPRFNRVEGCFVIDRKAMFGGDARLGKQFINDKGMFSSTVNDLEQYSEILAEGRHFIESLWAFAVERGILTLYPDQHFQPELIASAAPLSREPITYAEAALTYQGKFASLHFLPQLTAERQEAVLAYAKSLTIFEPKQFHAAEEDLIWEFLRHRENVPNYFDQKGKPNQLAKVLHACIRQDLVGLVYDFTQIANVQEWTLLETGDVVTEAQMADTEVARVWLEVDLLEKALSYRATLQVTAAKILDTRMIRRFLKMTNMEPENIRITDVERMGLLAVVYTSDYPDKIHDLFLAINSYLADTLRLPYEERLAAQLGKLQAESQERVEGLRNGSIQPITRYTEPEVLLDEDDETRLTRDILDNPLRHEIFLLYTRCEKFDMTDAMEILRPAATDPNFRVTEESFAEVMNAVYPLLEEVTVTESETDGVLATKEEKKAGKAGNHELG